MNKIMGKKNELLEGKIFEIITATMKEKRNKKRIEYEIGKVKSIGVGIDKTYDHFVHWQSLLNYESSLKIWEKIMEEAIVVIKFVGNNKKHLPKYDASLQMWEKSLMEAIAVMDAEGDVFSSSTIHE